MDVRRTAQFVVISICFFLIPRVSIAAGELGGIRLLEGYSIKQQQSVDAQSWTIEKSGGPKIHFEAGPSEGSAIDPKRKERYSWYREQTVNGYEVRFALTKRGIKTRWDDEFDPNSEPGGTLFITFLLEGENSSHTADFTVKTRNDQDLADVLLMVLTFDPSKGTF
jgi:hypothetical protein